MNLLTKDAAEKYYDEIINIHTTGSQRIGVKLTELRTHVLDKVLYEITGSLTFNSNDIKVNTQRKFLDSLVKEKKIPYPPVSDIINFVAWRNEESHPDPSTHIEPEEIDYLKSIKVLASTINIFSDLEIPEKINVLYASRDEAIQEAQEKTQEAIEEAEAEKERAQRLENELIEKEERLNVEKAEKRRAQRRADKLNREKQEVEEIVEWQEQKISKKKMPLWKKIVIAAFSLLLGVCLFFTDVGRVVLVILAVIVLIVIYNVFKD